jgi:hypothetical protein
MKSLFVRTISRVLILCMSAVSFQASAEMIGTGEVAAAVAKSSPGTRAALVSQLESFGLDAGTARDRVAALTDAEVAGLTGRLADLPAGAIDGIVIGIAAVVIFLIWRFGIRDQQAAASKEPAKK